MSQPRIHRLQLPTREVSVVYAGRTGKQEQFVAWPTDGPELTDAELQAVEDEIARRHTRFMAAFRRATEADIEALYTDLGGEGG